MVRIVTADPLRRKIIASVANLALPECWIAGGFVRNPVWNELFGKGGEFPATDVDVCYFRSLDSYDTPKDKLLGQIERNEKNAVWDEEAVAQARLEKEHPGIEFEVKNQARMYFSSIRTVIHEPYTCFGDALAGWVETATSTGIRLEPDGTYSVFTPYGLDDLMTGVIRPARPEHVDTAMKRAEKKGWLKLWPGVHFEPYDEIHSRRR